MDFKPQNMVYVNKKEQSLKAIDFSGSILLNGQRPSLWMDKIDNNSKMNDHKKWKRTLSLPANVEGNINLTKSRTKINQPKDEIEKVMCTRQYLPPELDNIYLFEQASLKNTVTEKVRKALS